jgi:flagellar FliL protein
MADEKTTPEPKSKKKLFMIVGGVLVLALGGGGFMFMKGGKAEAAEDTKKEKEVVLGELIRLDPITLNLADGDRYLKVGVSVQMQVVEGAEAGGGGHGGGSDALEVEILDETIHVLGGMTFEQLTKEHGREKAKENLLKALKKSTHDQAYELYFTDFVAQ